MIRVLLTGTFHHSFLLTSTTWPSLLFLELDKLIPAGGLWTCLLPLSGCLGKSRSWRHSGHCSSSSSQIPLLTTLMKVTGFALPSSLFHHLLCLPEIILSISLLVYNSECKLCGSRDLFSIIHCFKPRIRTVLGKVCCGMDEWIK